MAVTGKASFIDELLDIMETSGEKNLATTRQDIADRTATAIVELIQASATSTEVETEVITDAPATGTGEQSGAPGTIIVPA